MTLTVKHKVPDLVKAVDRLNTAVKDVSSSTVRETDTRLRFLIANTLNELREIFDQSLDKVDTRLKEKIDSILLAVQAIEERLYDKADLVANKITRSFHAGLSYTPLFFSIEPTCLTRTTKLGNTIFKITGYFPNIGAPDIKPSLTLNGHQATLIKPTTGECLFSIPTQAVLAENDACVADLTIPYTHLINRYVHTYKVLIGVLPSSPGTLIIEHTKTAVKREINPTPKSHHFHLISHKDLGKCDQNQLCTVQVTPGWKVLPNSEQLQIHHNKGETSLNLEKKSDTEIAYRAITHYKKSAKACGELRFTLSLTEYRDLDVTEPPVKIPLELGWNSSQYFNYPPKTWKVTFTPFDQPFAREYFNPTLDDPLINITYEGEGFRIRTKDPHKLPPLQITAPIPALFSPDTNKRPIHHSEVAGLRSGIGHLSAKL